MIDGRIFFNKPVKNDLRTYDSIRKIATSQGDDYTTAFLLHYNYFKYYCKMITIDLSKQQALEADPRALQQFDFNENLDRTEGATMFLIIEEGKETVLDFLQGIMRLL